MVKSQVPILQIRPIVTSVTGVVEITGMEPTKQRTNELFFKLKEGNLYVGIAPGPCVDTIWGSWNVPKGSVLYVKFNPKQGQKASKFKLDPTGSQSGWDQGHKTYTNLDTGVYYSTEYDNLSLVHIFPAKQFKNLECESSAKPS